jgi:CRISPR/Cas system endoribonuclease Cas6 (RAMP superfamily)
MIRPAFAVARYRFEAKVHQPFTLPWYAGSTLRGVFGNALRRLCCMTKMKVCDGCPLYRSCPYPQVFEHPVPRQPLSQKFSAVPNPYMIEAPEPGARHYRQGDRLCFEMVLLGPAAAQLALVIEAWRRALNRRITRQGGAAQLETVSVQDGQGWTPVYSLQHPEILDYSPQAMTLPSAPARIQMRLVTPMRLQHHGEPLKTENFRPAILLDALRRRWDLLHCLYSDQQSAAPFCEPGSIEVVVSKMKWADWHRFSRRQQKHMGMGGLLGTLELAGDGLQAGWPLLYFGQWLHVGKNSSFGLGRYVMESPHV